MSAKWWTEDNERRATFIDSVKAEDGGWSITEAEGWSFWVPKDNSDGVVPLAGQEAIFFGRGIGYPVRGLVIDGRVVFYRTAEQEEAKHREDNERMDREKRETFEAERESLDAKVAALPDVFRRRIERFRSNNPNFRWEFETYELSACIDAVKIAEALKTKEAVKAFMDLKWEEQNKLVPGLDEGHSGNTFGMAVRLAFWYVTEPENVYLEHAAIAALVGCDEAGCPPVKP